MRDYYCKSILDEDCISVNELNCDNLILYCTGAAVPHKALIIRWLKTVGIEYRIIDFENTFDPVYICLKMCLNGSQRSKAR